MRKSLKNGLRSPDIEEDRGCNPGLLITTESSQTRPNTHSLECVFRLYPGLDHYARFLAGLRDDSKLFGDQVSVIADYDALPASLPEPNRTQRRSESRESARILGDPHRRRKLIERIRSDATITRPAIATLTTLLDYSDDYAKPVWPGQKVLAKLCTVSPRTVQRHIAELRDAGYLVVYGQKPKKDHTGKFASRKTNRYYFRLVKVTGLGRRVMRMSRSHLPAIGGHDIPLSNGTPDARAIGGGSSGCSYAEKRTRAQDGRFKKQAASFVLNLPRGTWSDSKGCDHCDFTTWVENKAGEMIRCSCAQ